MHSKQVLIIAQVLISGMMAFLMTAFFAVIHLGFTIDMLAAWGSSFVIAWPVAFCLSLVVSPLAFIISGRVVAAKTLKANNLIS